MARNIHEKPFDEETLIKLEIFETYTKEWLPTMIMSRPGKAICIFDFFAGPGCDIKGTYGTPLRILKQIEGQYPNIKDKKVTVCVWFNEKNEKKYQQLEKTVETYIINSSLLTELKHLNLIRYNITKQDFANLFHEVKNIISEFPTLAILDQNGIKFTSDEYFTFLCQTTGTDFLYYLSSSYFVRFGKEKAFTMNLKLDIDKARSQPYKYIHESVLEQLKERIPLKSEVKLYPFTIKRNANIYGIIFGASHIRAVDKFLKTAWKMNKENGSANFDINDDIIHGQPNLFGEEMHIPTKIELFQKKLQEKILSGRIKTNADAYQYTMDEGHITEHATERIRQMKRDGLITYDARSPLISYDEVHKNKRIIEFKLK